MEGRSIWLPLTLAAVIVIIGFAVLRNMMQAPQEVAPTQPGQQAPPTPGAVMISIASSNTKQDWLHQAVATFNAASKTQKALQVDGQPIFVKVLQEDIDGKKVDYRSGTMISDTLKGKIQPTILSPGNASWIDKFQREWRIAHNDEPVRAAAPIVVRTPLVIAMWQSRAKALGCWPSTGPHCTWEAIRSLATHAAGWEKYAHPQWGPFKIGYGYVGQSNSGTLGVICMCMVGANKPQHLAINDVEAASGCGKFISGIEKAKVHSGKSDVWLLEKMRQGGQEYLDAVVTYESNVILMNRKYTQHLREPLVAVYPQDGTVVVGHPLAVLDGAPWVTPEQVSAAQIFSQYLLAPEQQRAVLRLGLRPADPQVKLDSPIEPSFGANPQATLALLELPEQLVIDRIEEIWHQVKKHAILVILVDKSGSMKGEKIVAAVKGAQELVRAMDLQDQLMWMPFDERVYGAVVQGYKSDVGEELIEEIAATTAGGGTSLYDATLSAYDVLTKYRQSYGNTLRYGIVVLSDGEDTKSKKSLSLVESRLRPNEHDPTGIQIHTICLGADCDETVLQKIAAAAHGKFWKGSKREDIIRIYKNIAAHY